MLANIDFCSLIAPAAHRQPLADAKIECREAPPSSSRENPGNSGIFPISGKTPGFSREYLLAGVLGLTPHSTMPARFRFDPALFLSRSGSYRRR
jgi:hypothetical protein